MPHNIQTQLAFHFIRETYWVEFRNKLKSSRLYRFAQHQVFTYNVKNEFHLETV
jgi:hypothetical protein